MQTLARRDGDEWVVTGEKHYTTNGTGWDRNGAHLYTVVCRTDPPAGPTSHWPSSRCPATARGSASSRSTTSSATAAW